VADFGEQYRQAFASLGRRLGHRDGMPARDVCAAERRLGVGVPAALREYYRVAGRADDFNRAHEQLLRPADWSVESGKLVFMTENQGVYLYGTPARPPPLGHDPAVFMAENDEPVRWHKLNERCSAFLLLMLHVQAAYGGAMPYSGTGRVRAGLRKVLDRDWLFVGELGGMRAYHKPGRAVCFDEEGNVFAGAGSEAEWAAVAADLSLRWEYPFFYAKGIKVAYSVQGEGEPVVLIHGLFSSSAFDWGVPGTTSLLAEKHHVLTIDLRGHGRSDKPTVAKAYGLELVEDVIRLMDRLAIKKAHVVGYCVGSIVAAKIMAKYPDRILSGTLGGMGWFRGGAFAQKVLKRLQPMADRAMRTFARSIGKLALTKTELESIRVPMIVLIGERDEVVKKLYVEPLRQVRTEWRVVHIKDANHLNCQLKPQFKAEMARWLTTRRERGPLP
jgi:pimeloyl-ACP methyl ester carboxylesterase